MPYYIWHTFIELQEIVFTALRGFYINGRPGSYLYFPRSCKLRGKGLINLLARKVKGDDPKIKKQKRAKSN